MDKAAAHNRRVENWTKRQLAKGPRSFGELVLALPGVYPIDVRDALARLELKVDFGKSEPLVRTDGPTPHPLDGDWRFHPDTRDLLAATVRSAAAQRVALFGCPSLLPDVRQLVSHVGLVEANLAWRDHLGHVDLPCWGDVALCLPRFNGAFDLAVADPPWATDELRRFLTVAAHAVKVGGKVLLCGPEEGTRPGVAAEWHSIFEFGREIGMKAGAKLAARYWTPFYEASALKAAGLPVLSSWRKGRVVVFKKTRTTTADVRPSSAQPWSSFRSGIFELRVNPWVQADPNSSAIDPRLIPLLAGDVLPSVSSRDPRRPLVRAWTGANRVFGCASPTVLKALLAEPSVTTSRKRLEVALAMPITEPEWARCRELKTQLKRLELLEHNDYREFHDKEVSIG